MDKCIARRGISSAEIYISIETKEKKKYFNNRTRHTMMQRGKHKK
jgi:hypothetical protein